MKRYLRHRGLGKEGISCRDSEGKRRIRRKGMEDREGIGKGRYK